jgi:hypothetical protein
VFCADDPMFLIPTTESSSCLPRLAVGAKRLADLSLNTALTARSRRTPAMPILPLILGAFRSLKPNNRVCCDTHWMARWLKAPDSMGKISAAEVLRLRATSAVLGNRSVRRFAQDDDSVAGIKTIGSSAKNTKRSKKSQALPRQAGAGRMTSLWGS